MAPLAPFYVTPFAHEVRQAGYWLRVDGNRLYLVARRPNLLPVSDDLTQRVRQRKAATIAAARIIPPGCNRVSGHLYVGRCVAVSCAPLEEAP